MEQVLLVVHVIIAAALIGMVLLQRSETDGFGLGGGGGSNLLSGRSTANLLTRTTAILAALFIINSLVLSILASRHGHDSLVDTLAQAESQDAGSEAVVPAIGKTEDAAETPAAPAVPNADAAPAKSSSTHSGTSGSNKAAHKK